MKLHDIFKKTKTIVKNFRDTVAEASREPEYPSVEPIREEGEKTQELVLRISGKSVAKATIIILSLLVLAYLITQIADILVVFFVAFLLAAAMEPAIDSLNKKKIPRGVAVIFFYIAAVAILGFIVAYILPILAQQISELAVNLGRYLKGLAQGQQTGLVPLRFQPYVQQFLKSINV